MLSRFVIKYDQSKKIASFIFLINIFVNLFWQL